MNGAPHVVFNENFDAKVENKNKKHKMFIEKCSSNIKNNAILWASD